MVDRRETKQNKNDYKVLIGELEMNPFHVVNMIFALMCVIPLLVVCYIIIGRHFLYHLFLDEDGLGMAIAIFIACAGLLYAYNLVRNLIGRLVRYADEARLANNQKSELLLTVGSDIEAPLTILKQGISHLVASAPGDNSGIAKNCLSAAQTMSRFLEEVSNIPHAGLIRTGLKRELLDLKEIVRNEVYGVNRLAKKNSLDLNCAISENSAKLWGDGKKLARVAMILLSNAVKYTPEKGRVNVSVFSDDNTVQLSVKNSGPGLLPDEIDSIFVKWHQPERNIGNEDRGVEMSIVKDIVNLHNGHVTVSSKPDKETEFKVVLPRDLRAKRGIKGFRIEGFGKRPPAADANMQIAETINKKLQDLVDSYRADTGKMKFKRELISISPLVEDLLAANEIKFSRKHLALKKFIPQDAGSLWVDKEKLKEVFVCMLNNAIRYTFQDGSIMVKIAGYAKELRFEISSTGPGIPKDSIEKLFEKQDDVISGALDSVGMGLPMARSIVELHKGKIWVESEAGKGSKFILTLPRDLRERNILT